MATENELILRLRTEGVSTVKELKEAIKECRDQLVRLDSTSDDYKETINELVQYETKLTDVMKAGKNEVSAATGSYNALVNEMTSLKRAWKEVTDEAERAKLGRRIGELNAQLKEMDASIGNYQRNVGDYENAFKKALLTPQQELRNLRKELAQLEVGTEAYNRAFTRMTELTTQLRKQQEMLRFSSSDLGDIFGNLAGVTASLVGGLSAISAAMSLIGDEDKDMQEAMLKAQRMIQIVQGISALQDIVPKIKGVVKGIDGFIKTLVGGTTATRTFEETLKKTEGTTETVTAELGTQTSQLTANAAATTNAAIETDNLKTSTDNLTTAIAALKLERDQEVASLRNSTMAENEKTKAVTRTLDTYRRKQMELIRNAKAQDAATASENKNTAAVNENTKAQNLNQKTIVKTNNPFKILATNLGLTAKAEVQYTAATAGATIATAALQVALTALGIGVIMAVVAGIAKGVAELWKWVTGSKAAAKATDEVKAATERLSAAIKQNNDDMDFQVRMMEAAEASYDDIYEYQKGVIEGNIALAESAYEEAKAKEENTKKTWFNKKAREELAAAVEEEKKKVDEEREALEKLNQNKAVHDEYVKHHPNTGPSSTYNSQLKEAQNLYKQLQDLYKTDRQKLAETYEENKRIIKKYIKKKKEMNDALLLLERKYYDDLKKLAKENMTQIYNIHLNQEQRRLNLMSTWSDKYLDEQIKVEEKSYKIAVDGAAEKVGFEKKSDTEIARMDAATKKEYLERQKLYNNELFLLEKEHERKMSEMIKEQNKRKLDAQRAQLQINVENARSEEELLDAQIALAEFEAYTYIPATKEATESQEQHNLRIVQGVKAYEELIEKKKEANKENNDEQLRRDNDATEARIFNGEDSMQYYNKAIEAAQYYYDNLKQLQNESNEQFRQRQLEALDELVELTKARQEQLRHNWEDLANGIGNIFGSIADFYQEDIRAQKEADGQYSAESKRKFETVKRLQIAQATISTISGAIEAFMSCQSLGFPWGQIIGAVQAAAVTAAGIAEIAKIKNTKLDGGGDSIGGGTRYAVATPSITDYVPEGTTNLTSGQEMEDLANAIAKNPVRSYVVESDITAKQEIANQRRNETTF